MSYIVFDAETTVKNNTAVSEYVVGDEWGSAFHPDNDVVVCGWKVEGEGEVQTDSDTPILTNDFTVLVGHNIRFDMHYLDKRNCGDFPEWLYNPEHSVWDTQIVEYLLTAQQHKFASLDELAPLYGGCLKPDGMKEFWNNGGQTEDLDPAELESYLVGDVENTEKVYLGQKALAEEMGLLPLITTQMKALVATWEMRKNGMCFNKEKATLEADKLSIKLGSLESEVKDFLAKCLPEEKEDNIKPNSSVQLSRVLFGGSYKYSVDVPLLDGDGNTLVFKSGKKKGQARTKKEERLGRSNSLCTPDPEWETKRAGIYRVGDYELGVLLKQKIPEEAKELIEQVLKLRALEKDRTTYFEGYGKLAWKEGEQFFIHGDLNLCQTNTGRLSSSKPNMQNISGRGL